MNSAANKSSSLRGITCMISGFALLTLNDAILKWLTVDYPTGQIVFMRSVFVMVLVALIAWRSNGFVALRVVNFPEQLARAVLMALTP